MRTDWRRKFEDLEARVGEMVRDNIRRSDAHTRDVVRLTDEANQWRDHALMLGRALANVTK